MRDIELATSEAEHGRVKTARIDDEGLCDACGEEARVLACDSSEGEYGPVCLCEPCIVVAFKSTTALRDRAPRPRRTKRTTSK